MGASLSEGCSHVIGFLHIFGRQSTTRKVARLGSDRCSLERGSFDSVLIDRHSFHHVVRRHVSRRPPTSAHEILNQLRHVRFPIVSHIRAVPDRIWTSDKERKREDELSRWNGYIYIYVCILSFEINSEILPLRMDRETLAIIKYRNEYIYVYNATKI